MANTFTSINVHVIFHVKSTGIKILGKDLERTFAYIGGVINGIGGIPMINTSFSQGFRAMRSTTCLLSVVPNGTNFELKVEN